MDTRFGIHIQASGDFAAVEQGNRKFVDLKGTLEGVESMVKSGVFLTIGNQIAQAAAQIPQIAIQSIKAGLEMQATLETAQLGIAAVLKQFDETGQIESFTAAMGLAEDAIELLRKKAEASPATFRDLARAFQGTAGVMAQAGLTIREQVELISLMSQTLGGLGIRSDQILQESRALISGNITEDAEAARILGITRQQITQAREAGELYGFLTGKLGAFEEAAAEGANSLNQLGSNLEDALDAARAEVTKPVFAVVKDVLREMIDSITEAGGSESWATIGQSLADVVRLGGEAVAWATRYSGVMIQLGLAIGGLKLASFIGHLAEIVRNQLAAVSASRAMNAEIIGAINQRTVALQRETAATTALAAANTRLAAAQRNAKAAGVGTAAVSGVQTTAALATGVSLASRLSSVLAGARAILVGLFSTLGGIVTIVSAVALLLWQWFSHSRQTREEVERIDAASEKLRKGIEGRLAAIISEEQRTQEIERLNREIADIEQQRASTRGAVAQALGRRQNALREELRLTQALSLADLERNRHQQEQARAQAVALRNAEDNLNALRTPRGNREQLEALRNQRADQDSYNVDDLASERTRLYKELEAVESALARQSSELADGENFEEAATRFNRVRVALEEKRKATESAIATNAVAIQQAREQAKLAEQIAELETAIASEEQQRADRLTRLRESQLTEEEQALDASYQRREVSIAEYYSQKEAIIRTRSARELAQAQSIEDSEEQAHAIRLARSRLENDLITLATSRERDEAAQIENRIRAEIELLELKRQTVQFERDQAQQAGDGSEVARRIEEEKTLVGELAALYDALALSIGSTDETAAEAARTRAGALRTESATVGHQQGLTRFQRARQGVNDLSDPTQHYQSAGEGLLGGIYEYAAQLGTVWDQMSAGINQVANQITQGIGTAIHGVLTQTMSFGEAWVSIGSQVLATVIQMFTQMAAAALASAISTSLGISAISQTAMAQSVSMSGMAATTLAAMWIPTAIAASVATFGRASVAGATAWTAALLGGTAAAVIAGGAGGLLTGLAMSLGQSAGAAIGGGGPGYRGGGFTGWGPEDEEAGPAHRKEFYFPADVVSRYGVAHFYGLLQQHRSPEGFQRVKQQQPVVSSPAPGGPERNADRRPSQMVVVFDMMRALQLQHDGRFRTTIRDVTSEQAGEIAMAL